MKKIVLVAFLFLPLFLIAQEIEQSLRYNSALAEESSKPHNQLKSAIVYPFYVAQKNKIDTGTFVIHDTLKTIYSFQTDTSYFIRVDTSSKYDFTNRGSLFNNFYKNIGNNKTQFTKNITFDSPHYWDHKLSTISFSIVDTIMKTKYSKDTVFVKLYSLPETMVIDTTKIIFITDTLFNLKTDTLHSPDSILRIDTVPIIKTIITIMRQSSFQTELNVISHANSFFDDFSFTNMYPNQHLWESKSTYINNSFGKNPITIGVATFDALNEKGNLYSNSKSSFRADTLQSKAFRFDKKDSVFLSFYFQPGGMSIAPPKAKDSLLVQFYSPRLNTYITVWDTTGTNIPDTNTNYRQNVFRIVMIPIKDTNYLMAGFKFRIINTVSYSSIMESPGGVGNGDVWNVDYIYLGAKRFDGDTLLNDVAIIEPARFYLKHYQSIPYTHLLDPLVFQNEFTNYMYFSARNNTNKNLTSFGFNYVTDFLNFKNFKLLESTQSIFDMQNIRPMIFTNADIHNVPTMPINVPGDTLSFVFKTSVKGALTNNDFSSINDTAYFRQKFYNYYAYDDGSAESGYSLSGLGSAGAQLAYQFKTFKPDTLRAIDICFNPLIKKTGDPETYFSLTVWNDNNGFPNEIVYSMPELEYFIDSVHNVIDTISDAQRKSPVPSYYNDFNKFFRYWIYTNTPIIVNGAFYIGYQQVSEQPMSVGFDKNHVNTDKIFYNLDGMEWLQSVKSGSLMMRPVVGKYIPRTELPKTIAEPFSIYPIPASTSLQIRIPEKYKEKLLHYSIFDIYGRPMLSSFTNDQFIDVTSFIEGIYIFQIDDNGEFLYNAKFSVIH